MNMIFCKILQNPLSLVLVHKGANEEGQSLCFSRLLVYVTIYYRNLAIFTQSL